MTTERDLWIRRIQAADDLDALEGLVDEIAFLADGLRDSLAPFIKNRRLALQRREQPIRASRPGFPVAQPDPSPPPLASLPGLPAPDGRPLYAYRLDTATTTRLQSALSGKRSVDDLGLGHVPGQFVLWASEWFRRSYRGGGYSWAGLLAPLGLRDRGQGDQAALRAIVERGLAFWGRKVLRFEGGRSFLGSLAREGGFPMAAFADGGGWARGVLEAVIAPLLADPAASEERAFDLACRQRSRLPKAFSDEDFLQLCADLALAVVALRREAEPAAAAAGIPVLAWLGLNRPDWRESLPIVPGERAADALIDSLMTVEAIGGAGVGAERLLQRDAQGCWHEAARIALDGDVDSQLIRAIDGNPGRLRVFAAEDLARHLPGELAMFEPPALGSTTWSARSTHLARGIHRVPFAAALTLELRVGARNLARVLLPGGKPRRGQLLVAQAEGEAQDKPGLLKVIGSGSGHYRAPVLFLQVPEGWRVAGGPGETVERLGQGAGQTGLWRIEGGAFVTDDTGDRYRIRCGQAADSARRIDLIGNSCRWAEVTGNVDLFCGPPQVSVRGQAGRLFLREKGTRQWRLAPSPLPQGHYELGWREADGILLDRRTVAVLPRTADLTCSRNGGEPVYTLDGFGPVRIVPDGDAPVMPTGDGQTWRTRPGAARVHRFGATILWPDGASLPVTIHYPGAATIARWDGAILPHGSILTLDDLRDLVGLDEGRMELHAELREPRAGKVAQMVWEFDRELPLASIREDCASLLLPASIDAELLLDMHNGQNTHWRIRPFALSFQQEPAGLVARPAVSDPDVTFCGRAFADPAQEVCFGSYSLLSEANHRPLSLPEKAGGAWLVYLRRGGQVLTRPVFAFGKGVADPPATHLAKAMAHPPGEALDAALAALLHEAAGNDEAARSLIDELVALIASLDGLPPATFRVLGLLPDHPVVLARLAFAAPGAVMKLSEALPFAWFMLPARAWAAGAEFLFDDLLAKLAALPEPDRIRYAADELQRRRRIVTGHEPLLEGLFHPPPPEPVAAIVQRFANRAIHRLRGDSTDRYRAVLGDLLPRECTAFDRGFIDTFDAPFAAALAAAGRWQPDAAAVRHIKTVARTFPTYFAEAIAAWFKENTR